MTADPRNRGKSEYCVFVRMSRQLKQAVQREARIHRTTMNGWVLQLIYQRLGLDPHTPAGIPTIPPRITKTGKCLTCKCYVTQRRYACLCYCHEGAE